MHAKGSGAHGFFEVTEDLTPRRCANFLSRVGKRTPVFARNDDLVGNNTPTFFVRDASKFEIASTS